MDICCCLVTKSCPPLCNPLDGSTPDFPVLHYLPALLAPLFESINSSALSLFYGPALKPIHDYGKNHDHLDHVKQFL